MMKYLGDEGLGREGLKQLCKLKWNNSLCSINLGIFCVIQLGIILEKMGSNISLVVTGTISIIWI